MADGDLGEVGKAEPAPALTIDAARAALQPFLDSNPASEVGEVETRLGKVLALKKPWGDESLALFLPPDIQPLADALNQLFLPARFTAVWHRDTCDFEVIWTSFIRPPNLAEIEGRKFTYQHRGKDFHCEFARSSDRFLTLAAHARPVAGSDTNHRNIQSFSLYMRQKTSSPKDEKEAPQRLGEPLSFWIRNLEWNEEAVLELVAHLNFYMPYYDTQGPTVLVHTPKRETPQGEPRTRYPIGHFPTKIIGKPVDDAILHYWVASQGGDPAWRFIQSFRIIEYVSASFMEAGMRAAVRQILCAPHAASDPNGTAERVLAEILKAKAGATEEWGRFDALLRERVRPSILWKEVSRNEKAFSEEVTFDGGFKVGKLIEPGCREVDFDIHAISTFHKLIREIRNNLSHGKEQKSLATITPTPGNFTKLLPWASLISVAAAEVILNIEPR